MYSVVFREMIHAVTAQHDDEGDARVFTEVEYQGRKELDDHQCTKGQQTESTYGYGYVRDFCCMVVT